MTLGGKRISSLKSSAEFIQLPPSKILRAQFQRAGSVSREFAEQNGENRGSFTQSTLMTSSNRFIDFGCLEVSQIIFDYYE